MSKNDKMCKWMEQSWMMSLSFLDNAYVHTLLVFIVLLFASRLFENINQSVDEMYENAIVRVVVLFLVVYLFPKSPLLSILLAICYVTSTNNIKQT